MLRLGKYSGRIYKENEVKTMQECRICITEDQSKDEGYISKQHINNLMECVICCGCPYAIRNIFPSTRTEHVEILFREDEVDVIK